MRFFKKAINRFTSFYRQSKVSFHEEVYRFFGKPDNLEDSPMYITYINYALSTNERGENIAKIISQYINIPRKSFLDIGTAYGGYVVAFAKRGCNPYVGVDIDEKFINLAKLNLRENKLNPGAIIKVDISKPLPDILEKKRFDILTCADVLEHVSDVKTTLENIKSLLSDKGCILIEIPNRYHVQNVLCDPHYGLFGITLLDRPDALKFFASLRGATYGIGEYYGLDHYLSFFPKDCYEMNKIWQEEEINFDHLDAMFQNEIEMAYLSKIDSLSVPPETKDTLKRQFEYYISAYRGQMCNRKIDHFYIQTWRVLFRKR